MNIRRMICRILGAVGWIYKAFDCAPYYEMVYVCASSGLLPTRWCARLIGRRFWRGEGPKATCVEHGPTYVKIEVCEMSSLLPADFCPHLIKREFDLLDTPKQKCQVHISPVEVKRPYLGTSCYGAIEYEEADIFRFLAGVAEAGGNATEFFWCYSWMNGPAWSPCLRTDRWLEDERWPGMRFWLYDLRRPNEAALEKWSRVFRRCAALGIAAFVRIHDFCSRKTPLLLHLNPYYMHVDRKNLNMGGDQEDGLLGLPADSAREDRIYFYYAIGNRWLIEVLRSSGVAFFITPMNEASVYGYAEEPEGLRTERLVEFHRWFYADLLSLGVPADRILLSCDRDRPAVAAALAADGRPVIHEIHGVASPQKLAAAFADHGPNIWPSGDGADRLAAGRCGEHKYYCEPSTSQAKAMGTAILKGRQLGYAFKNRAIVRAPDDIHISYAEFDALEALTTVFRVKW